MRSGATQQTPTANPKVTAVVSGDTYISDGRLLTAYTDEQIWGGYYIIELDNDDSSLKDKDYKGYPITVNNGFIDEAGSNLPPLWVLKQEHDSKEGKLILRLICIDIWGLLSTINSTVGAEYWNYPEQAPGELYEDATHYNKTILQIITSLASVAGITVVLDDNDGIVNTQKPPIYINNIRTGMRQLFEMTKSFPLWKIDGKIHIIQSDAHSVVHNYAVANSFFSSVVDAGITIPNRVIFYGTDSGGNIISGQAVDSESYTRLGKYIDTHYYGTREELKLLTTTAQCTALAQGTLSKIQGQRNQGMLIAPMNCGQELLDKIQVVDDRYSVAKTTTGYVHRITREYDRGVYRITLYLGGVAGGYTPESGTPVTPREPAPPLSIPAGSLPPGAQAYIAHIIFTSVDYNTISWTAGTVEIQDGRTQSVNAGTMDLTATTYLYIIWGSAVLRGSISYSDAIGEDRVFVGVASPGSTTDQKAYVNNPFTDSIIINRDKVMDNLVNELKLAANAVSSAKLQDSCVIAGKIQTNAVTSDKIYAGSITAIKIMAGAVEATKLAAEIILGTVIYAGIGANRVKLSSAGVEIYGQTLRLYTAAGAYVGDIFVGTDGRMVFMTQTGRNLVLLPGSAITETSALVPLSDVSYNLGSAAKRYFATYSKYFVGGRYTPTADGGFIFLTTAVGIEGSIKIKGAGSGDIYVYSNNAWRTNT